MLTPELTDEPYPYSSTSALTRTPSVTATLTRPRTAGPKRVTMAEKMKQEEDVRREIEGPSSCTLLCASADGAQSS